MSSKIAKRYEAGTIDAMPALSMAEKHLAHKAFYEAAMNQAPLCEFKLPPENYERLVKRMNRNARQPLLLALFRVPLVPADDVTELTGVVEAVPIQGKE